MPVERLGLVDATFLDLESDHHHMHIGGLGIFEPGLEYRDVIRVVRRRIRYMPRARQLVREHKRIAGGPTWVDDPDFDLAYHVRHAALPEPGDDEQLGEFVSRLMSRPLDRDRPLWEMYVIDGLSGGRVGIFRKVHLAMANGQFGDPFGVLLDADPDAYDPKASTEPAPKWHPERPPGFTELVTESIVSRLDQGVAMLSVLSPNGALSRLTGVAESSAELVWRLIRSTPTSPLNRRLSAQRRFAMTSLELEHFRTIRRAFGGSITDAVIAVNGDAIGRLLRWRGHETKDLDLRVMVPVAMDASTDPFGNLTSPSTVGEGVVGVYAPLPVMEIDPVARLYRIMGEMAGLKASRQAVAAERMVKLAGYAPPVLHARAARYVLGAENYNVALSNAPGPQESRYLAGIRVEQIFPFIPLAGTSALSIAVSSYDGQLNVGLLGDRDALFDIERLAEFVNDATIDLYQRAVLELGQ